MNVLEELQKSTRTRYWKMKHSKVSEQRLPSEQVEALLFAVAELVDLIVPGMHVDR